MLFFVAALAKAEESAPARPTVVVIPTRVAGGPDLASDAKTQIEAPLGRVATLLQFDIYRRAVLASGHLARDIADPAVMRAVGPTVGATHVVVVAGVSGSETEHGKTVKVSAVEVSLIALANGETLYSTQHALSGPRMTRTVSTPIVAALTGKLASAVVAAPVVATAPAEPAPPPPATSPAPPVIPPSVPAAVATVPVPPQVPATLPVAPVPPPPDSVAEGPEPAPSVTSATPDTTVVAPIAVRRPGPPPGPVDMEPLVDLRLGMLMLARDGRINASEGTTSYDGAIAAPTLSLSIFPWARHEAGERGIGFYGEGYLTRVSADFGRASTSNEATVGGFDLGGAYRFAVGEHAPVVTVQGGYGYASFPISGAPFPGISYSSIELGVVVDMPLMTHLAGFVGGRVYPFMSAGGGSDRIGKVDSLYALRGEAGLRFVMAPLEVVAAGRFQQYNGSFNGVTDLRLVSELQNVDYKDRYYGGVLSVGCTF